MADRYWVAGGTGNYNSTTNWSATTGGASGATVPSTADNIFFNASSGVGTATINVASNCANLNLTGFLGTLAFTNILSVNGTLLNFGLGTYTVTGTANLRLASLLTITSNSTVYTGNIDIPATGIFTLADNMSCTGTITILSGGTTFNGNTLFIGGNLTYSSVGSTQGTTAFVFNGTGTWSHTSTGAMKNNVTINTAGTLTLGTNVYYNTGTLTYTTGTVITTGNTLFIGGNTTLNTNGISWNNIAIPNAGFAITLGSDLTLIGTLSITGGILSFVLGGNSLISANANLTMGATGTFTMPSNQTFKTLTVTGASTINANTLTITENLTINSTVSGTTAIIYGGTGTWSASVSGVLYNPLTINTVGTLTITGIVYKATGLFTYTAGTIIDAGATVIIATSSTLNISGKTWNKLLVSGTMTLTSNINAITFGTTGANATSFVLGGNTINFTHLELGNTSTTTLPTAWVCQDIEFKNPTSGILTGNSIDINGNIIQSGVGAYTGTTSFRYIGTGAWSSTSTGYFSNNFVINTAGTFTFNGGNIGGGIFTYTAGTVNALVGSTLYIRVAGTTMNDGILVWDNVTFGSPSGGFISIASITLNNQLVCLGTLTFSISDTTFGGTDGTFDVYNLALGIDTSNRTTNLVSTKTYRVRQSLICTQATNLARVLLKSSIVSSRAILTLDAGSTIDVGFVNATDIDSSLGRRIYSYKGSFVNTLNWDLLPIDVRPSSGVFVN